MSADQFVSLLLMLFVFVMMLIAIGGTILWIWMIIDCATQEPSESGDKVVWLLIILLTHVVGALIYYFVRRPQRMRAFGH